MLEHPLVARTKTPVAVSPTKRKKDAAASAKPSKKHRISAPSKVGKGDTVDEKVLNALAQFHAVGFKDPTKEEVAAHASCGENHYRGNPK